MNDMNKDKGEVNINKIQTWTSEREELKYGSEIKETSNTLKNEEFHLSKMFWFPIFSFSP